MRRGIALATAMLVWCACAGALMAQDAPEAKYQEALVTKAAAESANAEAVQKYEAAAAALKELKERSPEWKADEVAKALGECDKALAVLKGQPAAAASESPKAPEAAAAVAPSAAQEQPAAAQGGAGGCPFVGHKESKKVHRAECRWAGKIAERNRSCFNTCAEAAAAGYTPCKTCKPDEASEKAGAAPAAESQGSPAGAAFVGHSGTKKVHTMECQYGQKIAERNRVYFKTYQEAAAQGYVPCKTCKPDAAAPAAGKAEAQAGGGPGGEAATAAKPPAGEFCASASGKTFHRCDCEWARKISQGNLQTFKTKEEAVASGKKPCRVCNP